MMKQLSANQIQIMLKKASLSTDDDWNIPLPPNPSGYGQWAASPTKPIDVYFYFLYNNIQPYLNNGDFHGYCHQPYDSIEKVIPAFALNTFSHLDPDLQLKFTEHHNGDHHWEVVVSQSLHVTRWWESIYQVNLEPPGISSQQVAVTEGITTTDSETDTFSVSLGLEAGISVDDIGEKLTETISMTTSYTHSVALTEQKTTTEMVGLSGLTEEVTAEWWQLVEKWYMWTEISWFFGQTDVSKGIYGYPSTIIQRYHTYAMTKYPQDAPGDPSGLILVNG